MHQKSNAIWSLAILFADLVLASGTCFAQIRPYVGGGFGLPGMGFKSSYVGDVGVDLTVRRLLVEVEAGADTGNKEDTGNGYTFRTHGLLMVRSTRPWLFGGGIHYSEVTTSVYQKHNRWPILAAMYEKDSWRANLEYLLPGSDSRYNLTGPLLDLRIRLRGGLYWRQRLGAFVYRNPFEANPSYHSGSELDWTVVYVFHDRRE